MLFVFNKIDKVADPMIFEKQIVRYQPHVLVSAVTKEGLEQLRTFLLDWKKTSPSAS